MERFGSSGARGPVETELTPSAVLTIAQAAVTDWGVDRVAVGRDVRVTGPSLAAAAAAGATSAGADVEDLGILPTPAVQAYAGRNRCHAIVITASHNPPADNGIKLVAPDGGELSVGGYESIEGRLRRVEHGPVSWDRFGTVTEVARADDRYVDELVTRLDAERIADADLRVVVDAGTGAGAKTSPALCRRLGCEVLTLNAQFDGHFPARPSEPVPEAIEDLAAVVEATDAHLGVAHDGDADRAVFVDEHGDIVDGGAVLSALAASVAAPGDAIVAAISAPSSLTSVADATSASLELTRVGAVNVLSRVRALQKAGTTVAIAGEQNGGIIVPTQGLARDGAYTLGLVLEQVADRPLSEVVEPYTASAFRRRDIPTADIDGTILERVRSWATDQQGDVTEVDGIRVDLGDRWVLVRRSGTEPLVRVYAEAPTPADAGALIEEAVAVIDPDPA